MKEMDRTLFDFDDEVDNLSEVSERYKHQAGGMAPDSTKIVVLGEDTDNQPELRQQTQGMRK